MSLSPLKRINDEIYARWKAGENHIDLAKEYGRFESQMRSLLFNREMKAQRGPPTAESLIRTKPKAERNIALWADRKAGMSYSQLGEKYGICRERARQIIQKEERALARRRYEEGRL